MLKIWPIVGLLVLASCVQAHDPLDVRAVDALLVGWDAAGLPAPDRKRCQLDDFRVQWAPSAEAFRSECDATVDQAYSCLVWRDVRRGVRSEYVPVAYLLPGLESPWDGYAAVHELAHHLVSCALELGWPDPWDGQHTLKPVWRVAVPTAQRGWQAEPAWPPEPAAE